MKNISPLLWLILFFLPLLVGYALLERRLSEIPTSYTRKQYLLTSSPKTRILILGSSHGFYDINPEKWPVPSINMANTSQSLWYDRQILKKAITTMPDLAVVVLPISYFTLWYDLPINSVELWRQYWYMRFMHLLPSDPKAILQPQNYSYLALYSPPTVRRYLMQGFPDLSDHINAVGAYRVGITMDYELNDAGARYRLTNFATMMRPSEVEKNKAIVRDMISIAKKHHIKFVLVAPPTYSAFSSNMDTHINTVNEAFITSLTDNESVFSKIYTKESAFSTREFLNNDHLNMTGADHFSALLYKELIDPILPTVSEE
jgi:hypothetical protein